MTKLLQQAVQQAEQLADDDQNAIATRLLAEVEDERNWANRFAATTNEQWDRLTEKVRRDLAAGSVSPLDDLLSEEESAP